jgi:hypothetical protein
LWIASIDASTVNGPISSLRYHYTTDPTWRTNVSSWLSLTTKFTNLPVGIYYVEIEDGIGCRFPADKSVKLESNNLNITFEVGHTDTNQGLANGQLKILSYDENTGNGSTSLWGWHYTTDPTWTTNVSPWYGLRTTVTLLPVGKYYVQVKDAFGCLSASSEIIIDYVTAVSTVELPQPTFNVIMRPNREMFFEFASPESVNARIDIYDVSGRLVKTVFNNPIKGGISYEAKFKKETVTIGIYIYRMTMGNKVYNGKVVF